MLDDEKDKILQIRIQWTLKVCWGQSRALWLQKMQVHGLQGKKLELA